MKRKEYVIKYNIKGYKNTNLDVKKLRWDVNEKNIYYWKWI